MLVRAALATAQMAVFAKLAGRQSPEELVVQPAVFVAADLLRRVEVE